MARVSVIIPTYNRAHLLPEAIDSVLAQTWPHYEIIVADDGSCDDTSAVVASYGERVNYVVGPHRGGAGAYARNLGLQHAHAEFIGFLDSDDRWLPHKLARQIDLLDADPQLAWCYSDAVVFDDESGESVYSYSDTHAMRQGDILVPLFHGNFVPSITPLIRRSALELVGEFWPTPKLTDWDMMLRIAAKFDVAYLPDVTAEVRLHRQRVTDSARGMGAYDAGIAVLNRALARDPERLTAHFRPAHAALCWRTGLWAARQGDLRSARALFMQSARLKPRFRPILFCMFTLAGNRVVQRAGRLRMSARSRRRQ